MTGLKRALYAFWSQFGVPAYLTDCVPDDAQLPYITYNVRQPALNNATNLTAFNWHDAEKGGRGNTDRTELMDRIAAAIPGEGITIPVDWGYIILQRNETDFQIDWQDETDENVVAGRTSYNMRYYTV